MKLHNISFNNLKRRKGKMIFLVLGLFIGIATIVTLMSITESAVSLRSGEVRKLQPSSRKCSTTALASASVTSET